MVNVDHVAADMDDDDGSGGCAGGGGSEELAVNRRSLVDERRMLFEKIVTNEIQQQQPLSVRTIAIAGKNNCGGGGVRRSLCAKDIDDTDGSSDTKMDLDTLRSDLIVSKADDDDDDESDTKIDETNSDAIATTTPPLLTSTSSPLLTSTPPLLSPLELTACETTTIKTIESDRNNESPDTNVQFESGDGGVDVVPSSSLAAPQPSPVSALQPQSTKCETETKTIECGDLTVPPPNVSPKRISYCRAVSDKVVKSPSSRSSTVTTTCFVTNDRNDAVVVARSSELSTIQPQPVPEPDESNVTKRVSYHRAVFDAGAAIEQRRKSSSGCETKDNITSCTAAAAATAIRHRRSHDDLNLQRMSEQSSNYSSRTSRNKITAGVVKSSPSVNYPQELNPFGVDDCEEEENRDGGGGHSPKNVKPNESVTNKNPFDTESEDENEKMVADSNSKNPFGSDEEKESSTETSTKADKSTVILSKVPVPLPRTVDKLTTSASPRPSPRPRNKNNDSSNDVSPTASCRSMPSSTVRRISGDSLEFNLKKSPSSVGSTLRKKKPAPPPPPLSQIKLNETKNTYDEQTEDSSTSTKNTSNATNINIQKMITTSRKTKKGPAPARPIPIRRPVKEMPLEDIKTELSDIEVKQQELERQGSQLEESIREKTESESAESPIVEEMVLQAFELVNEKNDLFRRKSELMNMRKMHQLEEEHAEIEYQIRCLMLRPESNKTDSDKTKEEELIKRLLEIVEKRNEIIETMENDRLRRTAEDISVTTQLENDQNCDTVKQEVNSANKKNSTKKSKKDKQRKEGNGGGGKESDNVKHSPSKLIKQKFMTLRQNSKKSQQTKMTNN